VDLARDQFTVEYDASVVLTDRMNEVIVELGYRPKIVQSPIDLGISRGPSGPLPEVVASALDEAKETGRLVFVDFHAEWCGACRTLHRTTFKDPQVEKVFERFVFVKVDADQDPEAAKYFDVMGLPTLVALQATGEEVYRHVGPIGVKKLVQDLSLLADKAVGTKRDNGI